MLNARAKGFQRRRSGQLPRKPTKDSKRPLGFSGSGWSPRASGMREENPAARDNGPARPAKEVDGFPPRTGEATRSRPLGRQAVRAKGGNAAMLLSARLGSANRHLN